MGVQATHIICTSLLCIDRTAERHLRMQFYSWHCQQTSQFIDTADANWIHARVDTCCMLCHARCHNCWVYCRYSDRMNKATLIRAWSCLAPDLAPDLTLLLALPDFEVASANPVAPKTAAPASIVGVESATNNQTYPLMISSMRSCL